MKRKIELPTYQQIHDKYLAGEEWTAIEALVNESGYRVVHKHLLEALQEAYNQGYEDGRGSITEDVLEACEEWSGWVEADTAPRTLRKHIELVIHGEEE